MVGCEINFESRVVDFGVKNNAIQSIRLQNGTEMPANRMIPATGHSARDIYYLLDEKKVAIKAKSFAMGVRVEHPQQIIDSIQYHCKW